MTPRKMTQLLPGFFSFRAGVSNITPGVENQPGLWKGEEGPWNFNCIFRGFLVFPTDSFSYSY